MAEAVGKMVKLGHRRIVMIARSEKRKPKPALYEQKFLDELEQLGIATGPYHLPDWEQTVEGLHHEKISSGSSQINDTSLGAITPRCER